MVVAMIAMLMVQPPFDEVVDVIAVRHGLMSAARTVDVTGLVALMAVFRGAAVWIFVGHVDGVRHTMIAVRVVKLPIMEIVDVVAMPDSNVTASRAVFVRMLRCSHGIAPRFEEGFGVRS